MLQDTVAQRAQMFESLSGSEREQLAQYQILKDTLDNVNQELAQKHAQVRVYRSQKQALLESYCSYQNYISKVETKQESVQRTINNPIESSLKPPLNCTRQMLD